MIRLKFILLFTFLPVQLLFSQEFIKGFDLSMLQKIEDNGGLYYEEGIQKDALQILKEHGANYIRLRLWHTPAENYNSLGKTILMAERIKSYGFHFLLDFHYSDTWADPGKQTKPAAWDNLSFTELKDSIYSYTFNVISALKNHNALPDIVQIGNEITCGILWNDGRVCDEFNTPQQWQQLSELLNKAISGVNDNLEAGDSVKIMIHIDRGGDNDGARWFFDNLLSHNVYFDLIGLSFYPWWHGTLNDLQLNLDDLALRYNKDIVIVETAYPWTLDWFDNVNNIVGDSTQLLNGYPATVDGQESFLIDEINIIKDANSNKGKGIFYWAPEWIPVQPFGSPWENVTLFDFYGEVLPSITAFEDITNYVDDEYSFDDFILFQNYPNPFNPTTIIKYIIPNLGRRVSSPYRVILKVYDVLGNEVATLLNEEKPSGVYEIEFDGEGLAAGFYYYRLTAGRFSSAKKMILLK